MRKLLVGTVVFIAALLGAGRMVLRHQVNEESDEIDLAVVAAKRRYRIRAQAFIGATILVIAGDAELDLRRAVPGPTGIDVDAIVICGRLAVVANPEWSVDNRLGEDSTQAADDSPTVRVKGQSFLGRVVVQKRTVPTTVAL